MIEQVSTPVLVAKSLRAKNIPRDDIRNLSINRDPRSATHPWWILCDSIRADCQFAVVRCQTEASARVTMERIQQKLDSDIAVVDADAEHIQAVCSLLINWEFGEFLNAEV